MKRNLFLLFVTLLLLAILKQTSVGAYQKLEPLYVTSQGITLEYSGSLFIPKTVRVNEEDVNRKFVVVRIASKNYVFENKGGTFWNVSSDSKEILVRKGSKITSSVPVKMFVARSL